MTTQEEAQRLLAQYEGQPVVSMTPDETQEGDYVATLKDGSQVLFYTDDHHHLVENRVHIVSRK